ncbi:MAG: SIS domain-containing protein [Sandaracinaceae bacterium]|nr:MAG: SIS domain-containing protein [Sandaracinaceae bacterium]HBQ17057.1 phosphoheptose isomerase [Myxococcales bacterium]
MSERPYRDWIGAVVRLLESMQASDADDPLDLEDGVRRAVDRILAVKAPNKVMLVGNGGSAAIARHMHNDLVKCVGVRAQVFFDVPLLTAITNDDGYEEVFEQPIRQWTDPGDVLVAISSSGRSENILRAARAAREAGADVIAISGFDADNPLRAMGSPSFWVDSHDYGAVESSHTILTHYLTDRAAARRGR